MQYTIESRPLYTATLLDDPRTITIEASDAGEALTTFARDHESEIVSFHAMQGRESIATVKKNDAVFLVRVYSN